MTEPAVPQQDASKREDGLSTLADSLTHTQKSPSPPLSDQDDASDQAEKTAPQDGGTLRAVDSNAEPDFPPFRKVIVIMAALYMSFFLVALVRDL